MVRQKTNHIEAWWRGQTGIVVATGPSLDHSQIDYISEQWCLGRCRIILVNDAYKLCHNADILYACDPEWWRHHDYVKEFTGIKIAQGAYRDQRSLSEDESDQHNIILIPGTYSEHGFCYDFPMIHFGGNSGFQAVNLAIHVGLIKIILIGFDMQIKDGKRHFFGEHPDNLKRNSRYKGFIRSFDNAAQTVPKEIEIINATPDSALRCFPMMSLKEALA